MMPSREKGDVAIFWKLPGPFRNLPRSKSGIFDLTLNKLNRFETGSWMGSWIPVQQCHDLFHHAL